MRERHAAGAAKRGTWERFEPGAVDRLTVQYGGSTGVDVRAVAENVLDFDRRKPVRNPTGLLVQWVREQAAKARTIGGVSPALREEELARYAAFQVEIFRIVATTGISPRQLADMLVNARREGMTALNTRTIDGLEAMGDTWPTSTQQ